MLNATALPQSFLIWAYAFFSITFLIVAFIQQASKNMDEEKYSKLVGCICNNGLVYFEPSHLFLQLWEFQKAMDILLLVGHSLVTIDIC